MTSAASSSSRHAARAWQPLALVAILVLATPAVHAQFKVIGADGKVTYTDREPTANDGRVTGVGARAAAQGQSGDADLPFELRQAASKYPVTLYTVSGTCEPCDQGRQYLKQRGVPFSERQGGSAEDLAALEKLSGGRDAPTLTLGAQVLRGFSSDSWGSYLDAAGYPRESRLPSTYQYRAAAPVVERRERAVAGGADAPATAAIATPRPAAPSGQGGIRF